MSRLRHQVGEAIATHALWAAGQRVAVAVSGGLDSVVLLDVLLATAGWHGGVLEVVTVDHGTRPGSAADADFTAALARSAGVPCTRYQLALGEDASEGTCREARFRAFASHDADVIALAHHRDDQAETVLINLLRGTGPGGLEGMARRRDRYVRPLLDLPRADLEAWAAERGLAWREDPSNASDRYLRNRVRNRVLPLLEEVRQGAVGAVARSATLAREQAEVLDAILDADPISAPGADGWDRSWVADTAPGLVRRALHRHIPGLRTSHADAIRLAAAAGTGEVLLPGGRTVRVGGGRVRLTSGGA